MIVALLFVLSCQNQNNRELSTSERYTIENNRSSFDNRIQPVNQPITLTGGTLAKAAAGSAPATSIELTLVASVSAPQLSQQTLYASHVGYHGNRSYVTYHIPGEAYSGAIEIYDVTNPVQPVIVSRINLLDSDFYTLELTSDASQLWVGGARDIYTNNYLNTVDRHAGAILTRIQLSDGIFTDQIVENGQASFAVNSVAINGDEVFVATGDVNGTFSSVNRFTGQKIEEFEGIQNAEYVVANNQYVAVLEGSDTNAYLHVFSKSTSGLSKIETVNLAIPSTFVGKNGIVLHNNTVYVGAGDEGIIKHQINGSQPVQLSTLTGGSHVSGLTVKGNLLLVASGVSGLQVLEMNNGYANLGSYISSASVNYVSSSGNYIFLASGNAGLEILRFEQPLNPFCTNQTVIVENSSLTINNRAVLTAMGTYLEEGNTQNKRWRVRNQFGEEKVIHWEIVGGSESGQFTLSSKEEVHFSTFSSGTLRIRDAAGTQLDVKAHGGSVRNLQTACN